MSRIYLWSRRGRDEGKRFREYMCSDGHIYRAQEQDDKTGSGEWRVTHGYPGLSPLRVNVGRVGRYTASYAAYWLAFRHEETFHRRLAKSPNAQKKRKVI